MEREPQERTDDPGDPEIGGDPEADPGPLPARVPLAPALAVGLLGGLALAHLRRTGGEPDPGLGVVARWFITAIDNPFRTSSGIALMFWALAPARPRPSNRARTPRR